MAIYVIGDVQGCFRSLQALLERVRFDPTSDLLWFTGDLVNRGPQSLDVLRFVFSLGDRALTVLGNHDLHLLAVACGQRSLNPDDTLTNILEAPDCDALLTWLRHRPLLHYDLYHDVALVHAGLPPQWTLAQALEQAAAVQAVLQGLEYQDVLGQLTQASSPEWTQPLAPLEKLRYATHCYTLLRYCDAAGRLALQEKGPPGSQPAPYLPWFAFPHRAHANHTIIFGHWASLGAYTAPGIYALDTGCVWGGSLTALNLETKQHISVACQE